MSHAIERNSEFLCKAFNKFELNCLDSYQVVSIKAWSGQKWSGICHERQWSRAFSKHDCNGKQKRDGIKRLNTMLQRTKYKVIDITYATRYNKGYWKTNDEALGVIDVHVELK
mgnify:CR=1 FL=1|tara:strand:+ start:62 stop:400 length:339 start_codon:yes stop_codon:yes gene_type:complete